jgi:BlaI family transcriptional regulator, penicillinase repressor
MARRMAIGDPNRVFEFNLPAPAEQVSREVTRLTEEGCIVAESSPTDRELEALKVLWERGEATVREIADAMNAAESDVLAYTTVLSLLQVMEQKGLVEHRRSGKAYVYLPRVERQSTFRGLASRFLEKVFDGAVDEYLVHALESKRLSDVELDQLEAMLVLARERTTKRPRKGKQK